MILTPEKMDFSKQTFSAIIYGSPGIGKTTLACSAPKPLLIDFDRGVSRVRADHRVTTVVADTYEEVWNDQSNSLVKKPIRDSQQYKAWAALFQFEQNNPNRTSDYVSGCDEYKQFKKHR